MGTSVAMLMSNFIQVQEYEDENQEYNGLADLFMAEKEKELQNEKRTAQKTDSYREKKRVKQQSKEYKQKRKERFQKEKGCK